MDITLVALVILCISIISLFFIGREEDKVRIADIDPSGLFKLAKDFDMV